MMYSYDGDKAAKAWKVTRPSAVRRCASIALGAALLLLALLGTAWWLASDAPATALFPRYVPPAERRVALLKVEASDDGDAGSPFDCDTFVNGLYAKPLFLDRSHQLRHNVSFDGLVHGGDYVYYQMCVAVLGTHKTLRIDLEIDDAKSTLGGAKEAEADLYLSTTIEKPTFQKWTWKSSDRGADEIELNTDLADWSKSAQILYLGIYGRLGETVAYSLRVAVRPVSHAETAKEYRARLESAKTRLRGVRARGR
jgi:hypothetical protein